jgi:GNAT superfamily N-acetyltransferase
VTPFYAVHHLDEGDPGFVHEVVEQAVHEFPEMHWQCSVEEAIDRIINDTRDNERVEITVRDTNGKLIGFAALAEDADSQVGEVLGVQWFYVLPDYRGPVGRRMMRYIVRFARASGSEVLAYTHRISEGRYEINYIKLEVNANG